MGIIGRIEAITANHYVVTIRIRRLVNEILHDSISFTCRLGSMGKNHHIGFIVTDQNRFVYSGKVLCAFAMDDERLKNGGTILTKDYFKEQLERIREIRLSERRFYQKITDIYATSIDYDAKAETTRLFFARVQNQLHWAIHGETAAETIYRRADSSKEHMGLTTWKDAPNGKIQKFDVVIAKNYLTQEELSAMARIVNAYLDLAELRAEEQVPMTMEDWAEQFEGVLRLSRKEILTNAGSISAKIAEQHALSEFEKYRIVQDRLYQSDFDRILLEKDSYTNELPEAENGGE